MDAGAAQVEIGFAIAAGEDHVAIGFGEHVLHQGARKPQAAIIAVAASHAGEEVDPALRGVGQADLLQRIKCRVVDAQDFGFGHYIKGAAGQTGVNGAHLGGEGRRASRPAGRTAAATACGNRLFKGHIGYSDYRGVFGAVKTQLQLMAAPGPHDRVPHQLCGSRFESCNLVPACVPPSLNPS